MTKEELKQFVDNVDDSTEIIVITTPEQAAVIPKRCERVDAGGKVMWLFRKLRNGVMYVAVAWVMQAVDILPKPQDVFFAAKEKVEYVLEHTDYNFPYTSNDNRYPHIAFESNGTIHYLPPSGLSEVALAETGSMPRDIKV